MKRILIIAGTRPEAIKLIPVYLSLRTRFDVRFVSSGQHREMLAPVFQFFGVSPDSTLDTMTTNQTLSEVTSRLLSALDEVISKENPQLVVVQGDTTTAMAAALSAYYNKVPVAHVEAGLRSFHTYAPYPEEVNRRIITQIAALHFAPTSAAATNLAGHAGVHVVGNTAVDSLRLGADRIGTDALRRIGFDVDQQTILVTAHRRESFGEGIANICRAVCILSEKYPELRFVYPVHLNPNVRDKVFTEIGDRPGITLLEPVGYDVMISLMKHALLILTDSGGIQEEAPALNVPVIVMRDVTERPEGVEAGCAVLAGTSTDGIVKAFEDIYLDSKQYEKMKRAPNPYGDGYAAKRIASVIEGFL